MYPHSLYTFMFSFAKAHCNWLNWLMFLYACYCTNFPSWSKTNRDLNLYLSDIKWTARWALQMICQSWNILWVYTGLTSTQLIPRSEDLSGFVLHTLALFSTTSKKQILDFVNTAINTWAFNSGKPVQMAVKQKHSYWQWNRNACS